MFAQQSPRANFLTFALLLALALLALFVWRTQSEEFYHAGQYYALGMLGLTLVLVPLYLFTLRPQESSEDAGTLNWYFGRAVGMALLGTLAGALLVGMYAYQGDETFLSRQLEWDAHVLEAQKLPSDIVEMIVEENRNEQRLHLEELQVAFFGSISSFGSALLVSCCFLGRGRRLRQPRASHRLAT
jgi:hypothetical protein